MRNVNNTKVDRKCLNEKLKKYVVKYVLRHLLQAVWEKTYKLNKYQIWYKKILKYRHCKKNE